MLATCLFRVSILTFYCACIISSIAEVASPENVWPYSPCPPMNLDDCVGNEQWEMHMGCCKFEKAGYGAGHPKGICYLCGYNWEGRPPCSCGCTVSSNAEVAKSRNISCGCIPSMITLIPGSEQVHMGCCKIDNREN